MASPMLSTAMAPLQGGMLEFSGLRSSSSLPLRRNATSDDFMSAVSFRTYAVSTSGGSRKAPTEAFRDAAANELKGILDVCDEPLVSVDFRCSDVSSTIDASLSMVMGDDMVKVIAWYDNEWGYSQRVVDLADIVADQWK
ncbi:unnamed protein product [Triticum turgidum subsp. durum]|uniref:Glyceraldehyde 3-phosphate dehydrogenase catalytic domain-containing protein n=1 Tax=Triticum turgidum subsp. durum TaxID=4567 RepID=A0A9R1NXN5_TRITD|nr:unnamed protein product [Triticum turgidum subsp. durum]